MRYSRFLGAAGFLMILSEAWKQWTLTMQVYGGHYTVWYFPFQLCSVPMYLCAAYPFLPEAWKRRVEVFLMDFTLLGALAVFLDTTGMQYPLPALTIHSWLWHLWLILLGISAGIHRIQKRQPSAPPWREFADMLPLWLICVVMATVCNIWLWPLGEISMFYISPYEPSTQIIVRDAAAILGIHGSNLLYLCAMVLAAAILHRLWQAAGSIISPGGCGLPHSGPAEDGSLRDSRH